MAPQAMSLAAVIDQLAQQLDVSPERIRQGFERLEALGLVELRIVDVPFTAGEELASIIEAGRGRCLCPLGVIERVFAGGTCGRGGCPYGGDF
jgi:hypothetical protein